MASASLATRWFGVLLFDPDGLAERELFPEDAEAIAERLTAIREGRILDEERELVDGVEAVAVADERLLELDGTELGEVPRAHADEPDVDPALRQEAAIRASEAAIEDQLGDESRHLVQAIAYLDETHEIENRMAERLRAWYGLHAPDVVDQVDDRVELARLVARYGDRESILASTDLDTEGPGSAVAPHELRAIQGLASSIVQQAEAREPLEHFVTELARDLAPNLSQLATPQIAARLIQQAGGLEQLGKLPAGTIQMLGAEEAVFKHLSEGADPPKHGVIYRHPRVHEAHPNDRGSIARAFAAKLAIAARADAFTGNDVAGELEAELEARTDRIQREGRRRAKKAREEDG